MCDCIILSVGGDYMAITEWELRRAAVGQGGVNIILCDDDPVFLRELHSEIDRTYTRLNMKATIWDFQSPQDLSAEQFATCDIAFLDIDFEREDCNGIDVARRLRQVNGRALILFVTNYIDYAPEGFEVQAFRYILKRDMGEVLERYILQAMETMSESKEYLQLREKEQRIDLPLEQISYLEVLDHYVRTKGVRIQPCKVCFQLSCFRTPYNPIFTCICAPTYHIPAIFNRWIYW